MTIRSHLPINHPARQLLRVMAALIGLYVLAFGIGGLIETWGLPFFDRSELWVLGLRTNPAFSVLSTVTGAVLLAGALLGRNVDHFINLGGGVVFLVAGLAMMTLLRTEANLLNFSLDNCIVSFLIGMGLLLAGLYGRVGSPESAYAEEQLRHGELSQRQLDEQLAAAGEHSGGDSGGEHGRGRPRPAPAPGSR